MGIKTYRAVNISLADRPHEYYPSPTVLASLESWDLSLSRRLTLLPYSAKIFLNALDLNHQMNLSPDTLVTHQILYGDAKRRTTGCTDPLQHFSA